MTHRNDIAFIRPYRKNFEARPILTHEYIIKKKMEGILVQVYLDNCSIQRMEELPPEPTRDDARDVGLLGLVDLLPANPMLSATGIGEMPQIKKERAREAYNAFCKAFWPTHQDDPLAENNDHDDARQEIVDYWDLPEAGKLSIGSIYAALLLIRLISVTRKDRSPVENFEFYFRGVTKLIGYVDAILLEIAKYAFWPFEADQKAVPESVKTRRRQIKENFMQNPASYKKGRQRCIGGAHDIWWLRMFAPKFSSPEKVFLGNQSYSVELWLGTHDEKLCSICESMMPVSLDGKTIRHIEVTRETELNNLPYWRHVDKFAQQEMALRDSQGLGSGPTVQKLDSSVLWIETELRRHYEHADSQ